MVESKAPMWNRYLVLSDSGLSLGRLWKERHVDGWQKAPDLDDSHPTKRTEIRKQLDSSNIDAQRYSSVRSWNRHHRK